MPKNKVTRSGDRYQYRLKIGYQEDGTAKYRYLKSRKSESLADFKERIDLEEAKATGDLANLNFNELWDIWHDTWKSTVSKGRVSSVDSLYEKHIKDAIGMKPINSIRPYHVQSLLKGIGDKGLSSNSLSMIKTVISMPFDYAIVQLDAEGLTNPTASVSIAGLAKERKKRRRVISKENLKIFFKYAKRTKYYNYYRLLNVTGFRPSEGLGLKLKDISDEGIMLKRGITAYGLSGLKNKNAKRLFPLTDQVIEIIEDQKQKLEDVSPEAWIFPAANGSPSMAAVNQSMSSVIKNINKEIPNDQKIVISPYDFRHTFATRAARVLPPKTLQYLMGHADIATTLKYYVGIEDEDISHAKDVLNMVNF